MSLFPMDSTGLYFVRYQYRDFIFFNVSRNIKHLNSIFDKG